MTERRYVIEYGDMFHRRVVRAPDSYGDDLLTREEAAFRIICEAEEVIRLARETRCRAKRVLRGERNKQAVLAEKEG